MSAIEKSGDGSPRENESLGASQARKGVCVCVCNQTFPVPATLSQITDSEAEYEL